MLKEPIATGASTNHRNGDQVTFRCLEYSLRREIGGMVRFVKRITLFAAGVGRGRRRGGWDLNTLIILGMGKVDMMRRMVGGYYGEHTRCRSTLRCIVDT